MSDPGGVSETKGSTNRTDSPSYFNDVQSAIQRVSVAVNGIRIFIFVSEKISQLRYNISEFELRKRCYQDSDPRPVKASTMAESFMNRVNSVSRQISFGISNSTPEMVVRLRTNTLSTISNTSGKKPTLKRISTSKSCFHGHSYCAGKISHPLNTCYQHIPPNIWEPYIDNGYLHPYMPWTYYLKALYLPTFELLNIWTHLLPCIYFMVCLYNFSISMDLIERWPLLLSTSLAIAVTFCSSLAHMFHSRSGFDHCWWFMVDYYGISSYAFSIMVTRYFSASKFNLPILTSHFHLAMLTIFAIFGFICCCLTQMKARLTSVKQARIMKLGVNALGYFYASIPIFHRLYQHLNGHCNDPTAFLHASAIICMKLAPILYGKDIPQRFWPGKFNIIGHSHQIFHILTASSMYFDIWGTYSDITRVDGTWQPIAEQEGYPTFSDVFACYIAICIASFIITVFLRNLAKPDYEFEKDFREGRRLCLCGLPQTCYEINSTCQSTPSEMSDTPADHVSSVPMYGH